MAKDFTLAAYKELLASLMEAGYQIVPVQDYFTYINPTLPIVILRHDVDRRPQNAFTMAEIEAKLGVSSTYYFRKSTFDQRIVEDLHLWGHEVGYHYEVMDKARGDIGLAHAIFNAELEILRAWVPVKTCAAHGNPLTKHDNREFFDYFDPGQFGLIGQAETIPAEYITDTGRGNPQYNFKDKLARYRTGVATDVTYYSLHPERWNDGLGWYRQWVFDWGCNLTKAIIRRYHG